MNWFWKNWAADMVWIQIWTNTCFSCNYEEKLKNWVGFLQGQWQKLCNLMATVKTTKFCKKVKNCNARCSCKLLQRLGIYLFIDYWRIRWKYKLIVNFRRVNTSNKKDKNLIKVKYFKIVKTSKNFKIMKRNHIRKK